MNVHFKKNQLPFLSDGSQLAFDCHCHSRYSDGSGKVENILKQAHSLGIGIALTDHNDIRGVVESYRNHLKVPVIPAIEVSCKGMIHLLLYFYRLEDLQDFYATHVAPYKRVNTNAALKQMTALKIAKVARQYKCIVTLAHPYGGTHREIEGFMKLKENEYFLQYVDCIEGLNGTINQKRNMKSLALAEKFKKGVVGGSDSHTLSSLGNTVTIARATTIPEFLDQLKKGEVQVIGDKINMYQRYKMAGVISYKHVKASTHKHHPALLASLGLYTVFQRFSIPFLFLLGAITYKKVREKRNKLRK